MFQSSEVTQRLNHLRDSLTALVQYTIQKPREQKMRDKLLPLYTIVYNFCNQKPSLQQKMFQQYKHTLSYFIQTHISKQEQINSFRFGLENSTKTIKWFNKLWHHYLKFMIVLAKKVFTYLDRYYLPAMDVNSLYKAGLKIFHHNVYHQHNANKFLQCYFKQLTQFRSQKIINNRQLIKFCQAISIIDSKNLIDPLAKRYLQQTRLYYIETFEKLRNLDGYKYYSSINNLYKFEKALFQMTICFNLLQNQTVFQHFQQIFVKSYTQAFIQSQNGLYLMFKNKNIQYIKVIAEVYIVFQGFSKIREGYYNFILSEGQGKFLSQNNNQLNNQNISRKQNSQKSSQLVIEQIYTFYKQQLGIITQGLQNKKSQLLVSLNNAVQKVISRRQNFTSDFYNYCKRILLYQQFNSQNKQKITILFQKLPSKDQFIGYYQSNLVKNIMKNNIQLANQQIFINYLNQICGSQLTHKLIKKLNDYAEFRQINSLTQHLQYNTSFNISIMSLQLWQKRFNEQLSLKINLPAKLKSMWQNIQTEYISILPKRNLTLLAFQNKLLLSIKLDNNKNLEINCNLLQACIILYLSYRKYSSQTQIMMQLIIQKNILQSAIQTFDLALPGFILKTIVGDYLINWNLNSPCNVDFLANVKEDKFIIKAIQQDREILVEAAIVKFIKKNKTATFQQLFAAVNQAIKLFRPQPSTIKVSVDKLIRKGYIQENQNMLQYVQ